MADSLNIARSKFEDYKCCANEVIYFKLIRQEEDIENDEAVFHPDMTHQLFGQSESIFGYKNLRINIYCYAARMDMYLGLEYDDKVGKTDGLLPDNVVLRLDEKFQPGYQTNLDEFVAKIPKDAGFKPFGNLIHSYTVKKGPTPKTYEIYKTTIDYPGFRKFHEKIQPFLLFYVDAASYIDVDDSRWTFYLVYEKYKINANPMYAFVGYMTVYNYFAYPEMIRPRISQVLILPPFQRQGHAATLIQTFYYQCTDQKEIMDITVEDPSENFQRVRDFVDARNCTKLDSFQPNMLQKGFSEQMVKEAKDKLKINKKQARRVYEILRLKATSMADKTGFKQYRLDIKRRLNLPFQKNGRDFEKLQRALNPSELNASVLNLTDEQRREYLEKTFNETVEEYAKIIERLATFCD